MAGFSRKMRLRAKLKKYAIVFPAMFLTFIVALWLIFGSGFSSDMTDTSNANMEPPDGDNAEIEGNKLKAMEAKALEDEKHRQDSVVRTFTEMADTMPTNISEEPTAIESSAQAYQSVQASLEDFYIPEDRQRHRSQNCKRGLMNWKCRMPTPNRGRLSSPMKWS